MTNDRLARIDPEHASDDQKKVIARLGEGRGRIPTPFNIWLHNPSLAEGMEIIGTHVDRSPCSARRRPKSRFFDRGVLELAYVIANHRRHALKAGVPDAVVTAILEKRRPAAGDDRFGLVCDAVATCSREARSTTRVLTVTTPGWAAR